MSEKPKTDKKPDAPLLNSDIPGFVDPAANKKGQQDAADFGTTLHNGLTQLGNGVKKMADTVKEGVGAAPEAASDEEDDKKKKNGVFALIGGAIGAAIAWFAGSFFGGNDVLKWVLRIGLGFPLIIWGMKKIGDMLDDKFNHGKHEKSEGEARGAERSTTPTVAVGQTAPLVDIFAGAVVPRTNDAGTDVFAGAQAGAGATPPPPPAPTTTNTTNTPVMLVTDPSTLTSATTIEHALDDMTLTRQELEMILGEKWETLRRQHHWDNTKVMKFFHDAQGHTQVRLATAEEITTDRSEVAKGAASKLTYGSSLIQTAEQKVTAITNTEVAVIGIHFTSAGDVVPVITPRVTAPAAPAAPSK